MCRFIRGKAESEVFGNAGGLDGECGLWADVLKPNGAEVLGTYTVGSSMPARPAITINTRWQR